MATQTKVTLNALAPKQQGFPLSFSCQSSSANRCKASLHSRSPTLQHNPKLPPLSPTPSPSWCRTDQTVAADQAETCMPEQEATATQPFASFYIQQNKRERHVPQRMPFCSQTAAQRKAAPALQKWKTRAMAVGRLETRQQVYLTAWISQ